MANGGVEIFAAVAPRQGKEELARNRLTLKVKKKPECAVEVCYIASPTTGLHVQVTRIAVWPDVTRRVFQNTLARALYGAAADWKLLCILHDIEDKGRERAKGWLQWHYAPEVGPTQLTLTKGVPGRKLSSNSEKPNWICASAFRGIFLLGRKFPGILGKFGRKYAPTDWGAYLEANPGTARTWLHHS